MNIQPLFDFLMNIPFMVMQFGSWLVTPLDYINLPPLALFGIAGITIVLGFHLIRLFVGG